MKETYKLEEVSEWHLNEIKELIKQGCKRHMHGQPCEACPFQDLGGCHFMEREGITEGAKVEYTNNSITIILED